MHPGCARPKNVVMNHSANTVSPLPVAWLAALLPLVTIHVCFLVSASEGYIDWCLPYWEGCSSISRAGRHGTAYFLFKGGMIPALVMQGLFWVLNRHWLRACGGADQRSLMVMGIVAAFCLLLYTLTLGHRGDTFQLLRRMGVMGYFGLTFIAQLRLSAALAALPQWRDDGRRLLRLCSLALFLGLLSVVLGMRWPDRYDDMEDGFEWVIAIILNLHALWVAVLWRRSGFRLELRRLG